MPSTHQPGKSGMSDRPDKPEKPGKSFKDLFKKTSSPNLKKKKKTSASPYQEPAPSQRTDIEWTDSYQTQWRPDILEERRALEGRIGQGPLDLSRASSPGETRSSTSQGSSPHLPQTPDQQRSTTSLSSTRSYLGPSIDTHSSRELAAKITGSPDSRSSSSPPSRTLASSRSQPNLYMQVGPVSPIEEEGTTDWPVPQPRAVPYPPVPPKGTSSLPHGKTSGRRERRLPEEYSDRRHEDVVVEERIPDIPFEFGLVSLQRPQTPGERAESRSPPASRVRKQRTMQDLRVQTNEQFHPLAPLARISQTSAPSQPSASPQASRPPILRSTSGTSDQRSPEDRQKSVREQKYAKAVFDLSKDAFGFFYVGQKPERTTYMVTRNQIQSAIQGELLLYDRKPWLRGLHRDLAADFVYWLVYGNIVPGGPIRYHAKFIQLYNFATSQGVPRLENYILRNLHWGWTNTQRVSFEDAKNVFLYAPAESLLCRMTKDWMLYYFSQSGGAEFTDTQIQELYKSSGIDFRDLFKEIRKRGTASGGPIRNPVDVWQYMADEPVC